MSALVIANARIFDGTGREPFGGRGAWSRATGSRR